MNFSSRDEETSLEKMNCGQVKEESDADRKKVARLAEKFTQLAAQLQDTDTFWVTKTHTFSFFGSS